MPLFSYIFVNMNEALDPQINNLSNEEKEFDRSLRPLNFSDFVGQESILENLKVFVEAANRREEALDHTLFHGPPGLGKTTLANVLAHELDVGIKITSWKRSNFNNCCIICGVAIGIIAIIRCITHIICLTRATRCGNYIVVYT